MKRGFVNGKDIKLAYIDFGGVGKNILLLHGLMSRATNWYETALWLKENFHVIGIDQRGHGRSDKPDSGYTLNNFVEDVICALNELNINNTIIIGHSMGGLIAWSVAIYYPERVDALIIEEKSAQAPLKNELDEWKKFFKSWPIPFLCVKEARTFFGRMHPSYADHFTEIIEERDSGYYPIFKFEHMLKIIDFNIKKSRWDELKKIQCPTLIIKGGSSQIPYEELERMANIIKKGQIVEIPDAGHVVHDDQPDLFRINVNEFLSKI